MIVTIIAALVALVIGGAAGYFIFRYVIKGKYNEMIEAANKEAEVVKEKKLLEVKEKFLNKKAELEKEVQQRNSRIQQNENKLKQREISLNQRQEDLGRRKMEIDQYQQRVDNEKKLLSVKQQELDKMQKQEQAKLEELSGLSAEEAKQRLIESLKDQAKLDAASYVNEIMDDAKLNANQQAKKIVIQTIQRVATETAIENSVSVFHIDNDEVKGRIIGREGRNIRALEAATGVEIVVDDTPEAIVISAFDPVRREVCRLALHQLVADGRIHPARIEEVVAKVKKQLDNEIMDDAKLNANQQAKKIVIQTIQRVATETAIENSVSVFHIDNDEVKGRIIGREGRNIRALEAATGVEIVVDDTPEAIVISAFDPVRREVCRLALHQLVADGRIHPARIEEVVAKVKKQLDNEIIETGKRTAIDLGIHGLHPELIRIIGKMKYRSSYGQNLLQHARETANLCAVMASELGLNPKKAKRAGLLHDIGKVPDEESELPHALYGAKIAEKYKEKPDICNAIGAHHDEMEMNTLLAPIVQVCDAISGARPGARREIVEAYIKRLNDLEAIAMSYPGVTKTYAIQAGRELRVIVGADKMNDEESIKLSDEIATKIQNEMTYPGQVKITVIRETRSVAYAK